MALVKIGQTDLPTPSRYRLLGFDLDSSSTARNEEGVLQRDRIRQGIYKVELEWSHLSGTDLATIESAIAPATFSVTFTTSSGTVTKTMYAGDLSREIVLLVGGVPLWNVAVNLIEV